MAQNEQAYIEGFTKRAQELGLEKFAAGFLEALKNKAIAYSPELAGGALGAIPGAAIGGGIGAMIPSEDEEGETHRMRNALIGALTGGATTGAGTAALVNANLPDALRFMAQHGSAEDLAGFSSPTLSPLVERARGMGATLDASPLKQSLKSLLNSSKPY